MEVKHFDLDIHYGKVSDKHLLIGLLSRFDNRYQAAADEFFKEISWTQFLCPNCNNKTRIKVYPDTVLEKFPLFCPKCKKETLINVRQQNTSVITEPDAKTQSR